MYKTDSIKIAMHDQHPLLVISRLNINNKIFKIYTTTSLKNTSIIGLVLFLRNNNVEGKSKTMEK